MFLHSKDTPGELMKTTLGEGETLSPEDCVLG